MPLILDGIAVASCDAIRRRLRMIEGLKVDLTAEELARAIDERIEHHNHVAADCDARRLRLQAVTVPGTDTEEQLAAAWPGYLDNLERRAERHRERAGALRFIRDHLSSHERYRLGQDDLESLRLWPQDTIVPVAREDAE
jgi:hypothetical protein